MKTHIFILFLLCSFTFSYSQDKTKAKDSIRKFTVIDKVPVLKGCEEFQKNDKLKKCMNYKIIQLIKDKFDVEKAYKLGISEGLHKIEASFKINNKGKVSDIFAFSDSSFLEEEAERVLRLMEVVTPGMKFGKSITIPYSIPIEVFISKPKQ